MGRGMSIHERAVRYASGFFTNPPRSRQSLLHRAGGEQLRDGPIETAGRGKIGGAAFQDHRLDSPRHEADGSWRSCLSTSARSRAVSAGPWRAFRLGRQRGITTSTPMIDPGAVGFGVQTRRCPFRALTRLGLSLGHRRSAPYARA